MSILNIFTRKAPTLGSGDSVITFDAVLEDTLEASVDYTQFPIEVGAMATDHGIIRPIVYTITGAVSNNPLTPQLSDFAGGVLSNFFDSGVVQTIAGISSGFLAGSDETRAGAVLDFLIGLMYSRMPFDVDAVDRQLSNMVITSIRRTRNPTNENGLEFIAELQELPLIATVISQNAPGLSSLPSDDPSQTQQVSVTDKGEVIPKTPSESVEKDVSEVLL
jgi:hypothetical protein